MKNYSPAYFLLCFFSGAVATIFFAYSYHSDKVESSYNLGFSDGTNVSNAIKLEFVSDHFKSTSDLSESALYITCTQICELYNFQKFGGEQKRIQRYLDDSYKVVSENNIIEQCPSNLIESCLLK